MNNQELLNFIYKSPTCFNAVENMKEILLQEGYIELNESQSWNLEPGLNYVVTRNNSSIIAFKIGTRLHNPSFQIVASHSDAPTYKVKPNSEITKGDVTLLNTEPYGGMIHNTWLDRPLGLAGRVVLQQNGKIISKVVNFDEDIAMICNLAIHMNRTVNDGVKLNPQTDMLPIVPSGFTCKRYISEQLELNEADILSYDLYLYPRQEGKVWGDYISSYHLDNLMCGYTTLLGFMAASHPDTISVYACFDNEEIGSQSRQGAGGTFMKDVLTRISDQLSWSHDELSAALNNSLLISADNAHGTHPAHPEKADPTNQVCLNGGIVIKDSAGQSYKTDSLSSALFKAICAKVDVPVQHYSNRSDLRGGSTISAIIAAQLSVPMIDIGLAQWAMHSAYETAGAKDGQYMVDAIAEFYNHHVVMESEGVYRIDD